MIRWLVFIIASVGNLAFSWRWLRNSSHHGYYRFFALEGLLVLLLVNLPGWFRNSFSPLQILSWLLLVVSLFLAIHSFWLLRIPGRPDSFRQDPTLVKGKKTTHLVTRGAYRYIRHPLYTSLLALGWSIFLKQPDLLSLVLVIFVSATLFFTARTEEEENLERFGEEYRQYMKHTRLFIPRIF